MNTIDIIDFKYTIQKFIDKNEFPAEVKRLVLKEIYDTVATQASNEAVNQAQERESEENK